MCGVVGIFNTRGQADIDVGALQRMNQVQFHRGPDEGGTHVEPGVGLGHRRLSIIDLSSGQQPLCNEDGSVVVVFNGEIYNHMDLHRELGAEGHIFKTHCDTEVIVHAWEQWGEQCVERFRGMFAFAIWDRKQQSLFVARDRLGIKPLYYALLDDGTFLFASELKSLLEYPGVPRDLDPLAIDEYFAYGYVPEPRSIFSSVKKLLPGYTLHLQRGNEQFEPREYWDIPFASDAAGLSEADAAEELVTRLRQAVDIRMVAEVPLGAFLSGGVDSSAVVAMMAGLKDEPVNTCSISFGDPKFNESEYAQQVADRYHTNHQVEQVDPDDFDLIDTLIRLYDEPYADSSAIPTYRVCELAKKRVTVALSGDGGDENLAGYRRYKFHMMEEKLRGMLPLALRRPLFGALGALYPKANWAPRMFRAKSTFQALARDAVEGYFHNMAVMPDPMRNELLSPSLKQSLNGHRAIDVMYGYAKKSPTDDPLSMVQYIDMKSYLPGDILTKVDRASMAHALEVRVPILDHKLVEWMSGLPPHYKLQGQQGKHIFKKSLEPFLPNDILYRKKMGFAVPLESWFRGPLRERVRNALLGDIMKASGYFNMDALRKLVDAHQSGARDHSAAIWSLLMFEGFLRLYVHKHN